MAHGPIKYRPFLMLPSSSFARLESSMHGSATGRLLTSAAHRTMRMVHTGSAAQPCSAQNMTEFSHQDIFLSHCDTNVTAGDIVTHPTASWAHPALESRA